MAKELPYFKFEPNQWDNGNIQACTHEEKGVFVDLISMYWSRLGDVPYKLAVQKICGGNASALDSLSDAKIIEIIDGNIYIKFLSEQLDEFDLVSKTNSKNAKEGWEKRRKQKKTSDRNATALQKQSEGNAIRGEERREDEKRGELKPLLEIFFKDLPTSSNFETISMSLNIPKETLNLKIPLFRKAAKVEYPNFNEFCNHFKNWVKKLPADQPTKKRNHIDI